MGAKIRWGILGAGNIARQFASGLAYLPDAELAAVGSRRLEKAARFASEVGARRAHGTYQALVQDGDVDVVYVATPHPFHAEHAILALTSGKSVLCEKPLAVNAADARRIIETARRCQLFCMEAMWTRFFPVMTALRELLSQQVVGEIRLLTANFSFTTDFDPRSRLFDVALAGGALLDVGVYPVALAFDVLGPPISTHGSAHLGPTGVDEQCGAVLQYESGAVAVLSAGIQAYGANDAVLAGTTGRIRIEEPFYKPTRLTITAAPPRPSDVGPQSPVAPPPESVFRPLEGSGYQYEAAEVHRCLESGQTESRVMPLEESLRIVETMDALRRQWGLVYPWEATAAPK